MSIQASRHPFSDESRPSTTADRGHWGRSRGPGPRASSRLLGAFTLLVVLGVPAGAQFPELARLPLEPLLSGVAPQVFAAVVDRDGDGLGDLLVGEPDWLPGGRVRLVSSATSTTLMVLDAAVTGDRLGASVAQLDDLNGDGIPELALAAPQNPVIGPGGAGWVAIHDGATGSLLRVHNGFAPGDRYGWSLQALPDLDADGIGDYAIGAPQVSLFSTFGVGYVEVCSGATGATLTFIVGSGADRNLGYSLATAGDWDADGIGDLAIGLPGRSSGRGAVRVYSTSTWLTLWNIDGANPLDRLGQSLVGLGDRDGNGWTEIAFGAPGSDATQTNGGRVQVAEAPLGVIVGDRGGQNPGDSLGQTLAAMGDANGDGLPDLAAAAANPSGLFAGRVLLMRGFDLATLLDYDGTDAGTNLRYEMAPAGDTNGDGFADLLLRSDGEAIIVACAGARRFATAASPGRILELDWIPGGPAAPHAGFLRSAEAIPESSGGLIVGLGATPTWVSGLEVVVDLSAGTWLLLPLSFGGTGRSWVPADLGVPVLAGVSLHCQSFALWPGQPSGAVSSNGLELRFTL